MFGKKKVSTPAIEYDSETMRPILKCSICNGEQVAGFKEKSSGKFIEVMLIKNGKDLDTFMEMYDLASVSKEY